MIKFAVLSIVGIMPVVNLHQWDTQLENIVLPLLSDIILLHIQNYPNIKNSGYFYGTAGILESKKNQHISMPILTVFLFTFLGMGAGPFQLGKKVRENLELGKIAREILKFSY